MAQLKSFVGTSYTTPNIQYDASRTVNMFPQPNEDGSGKDGQIAQLMVTPGLTLAASSAGLQVRGSYTTSTGLCFRVVGNQLQQLTGSAFPLTINTIGSLLTSTGPVNFADNGAILCVVDGPNGYGINITGSIGTGLFHIVDPSWVGATFVVQLDGFFIFNKPLTTTFYWADRNALTFTAATSGQSTVNTSDPIVAMIIFRENLWLFGSKTTEVWTNNLGTNNQQFAYIPGAIVMSGCAAPQSLARCDFGSTSGIMLLMQSERGLPFVACTTGVNSFDRMSTFVVDQQLALYTNLAGSTGFIYEQDGTSFYQLNPGGSTSAIAGTSSWVYDIISSPIMGKRLWHERTYRDPTSGIESRHLADNHCVFNGQNLIGAYNTATTYQYDTTNFTDNGNIINRRRRSPNTSNEQNFVFYHMFQLDCQTGVGLEDAQDLTVQLRYSDDGGNTWSYELSQSVGAIGQYYRQVRFWGLGAGRNRVFEVVYSHPTHYAITNAFLNVTSGVA